MSTAKAKMIAMVAVEQGWKGNIKRDRNIVCLKAFRNDEQIQVQWMNGKLKYAKYKIFNKSFNLTCQKQVTEKLCGWPDLRDLFKWFPKIDRSSLVEKYRDLPFELDDDNDEIMSKLVGRKIFWYCRREPSKISCDVVLLPKGAKSKHFRVVNVGNNRKMFHFVGTAIGFRSVLLDTIVKVG